MKYIISHTNDTAYNVALEDYAFNNLTDVDEIFMLWINQPSIIIGKNQNALAERTIRDVASPQNDPKTPLPGFKPFLDIHKSQDWFSSVKDQKQQWVALNAK